MKEEGRADAQRLQDIMDALRHIEQDTEGMSEEEFYKDEKTQRAVATSIMQLGDAAGRISKRTQNANPNVNWRRVSRFRYEPAHEYYALKPERLWEFTQDDVGTIARKIHKVRPAPESTD